MELNSQIYNATAWRDDQHCCLAYVDEQGRILRVSAIKCAWSGTVRFDAWFRKHWPNVEIVRDNGRGFHMVIGGAFKRAGNQQPALLS